MLRSRSDIYIIGVMNRELLGSKLPSGRECLSVLIHNIRNEKMNLLESERLVIEQCLVFWNKARIPTRAQQHCVKKLTSLYDSWKLIEKSKLKNYENQKSKEREFNESLDMLFDIAHANALQMIKIEEDRQFLINQRKIGRPGCMLGIDKIQVGKDKRKIERLEQEVKKKKKCNETDQSSNYFVSTTDLISPYDSQESPSTTDSEDIDFAKPKSSLLGNLSFQRPRKEILTPRIVAVLDKVKMSDRDSVHLLTAVLEALDLDPEDFILNRESIRLGRQKFRQKSAKKIRSSFLDSSIEQVFVHWDSKLLPNLTGNEKVDRLPVVVSGNNIEQLLEVPQISSSTGAEVSSAVYDALQDWNLLEKVQGCVFDTTASNTGRIKGAAFLLEQMLGREILFLACRHHVLELVLQAAVSEAKLYVSSGPDIPIFKRFKENWRNIDQSKFSNWNSNEKTKTSLDPIRQDILSFCNETISEAFPREDYQEFLHLVMIILGNETTVSGKKITIRAPGAYHQARWMGKALYCMKLFLFREQFSLLKSEENAIIRIVIFIIKIYTKPWLTAMITTDAPTNDINLIRTLHDYLNEDTKIAESCLNKFLNHLWYLNEETATFALFNEKLSLEARKNMAKTLQDCKKLPVDEVNAEIDETGSEKKLKLKFTHISSFLQSNLPSALLGPQSWDLFHKLNIDPAFLELEPDMWNKNDQYLLAKSKIKSIRVVNDTAERAVKLMEEFNNKLTKNEEQKQFLLQIVQNYRKKYPKDTRQILKAEYKS